MAVNKFPTEGFINKLQHLVSLSMQQYGLNISQYNIVNLATLNYQLQVFVSKTNCPSVKTTRHKFFYLR